MLTNRWCAWVVVAVVLAGAGGRTEGVDLGKTIVAIAGDGNHAGYALYVAADEVFVVQHDGGTGVAVEVTSATLGGVTAAVDVAVDFETSADVSYFFVVSGATPCQVVAVEVDYSGATPAITVRDTEDTQNNNACTFVAGEPAGADGYVVTSSQRPTPPRTAVAAMDTTDVAALTSGPDDEFGNNDVPVGCVVAMGGMQYWGLNKAPAAVLRSEYDPDTNVVTAGDTLALPIDSVVACTVGNGEGYFASATAPGSVVRVDLAGFTVSASSFTAPAGTGGFFAIEYNAAYNDIAVFASGAPAQMFKLNVLTLSQIDGPVQVSANAQTHASVAGAVAFVGVGQSAVSAPFPPPPPPPPPVPLNCAQHTECGPCVPSACEWCSATRTCVDPAEGTCTTLVDTCPSPAGASPAKKKSKAGLAVGLTFLFLVLIGGAAAAGFVYWKRQQNRYAAPQGALFDNVAVTEPVKGAGAGAGAGGSGSVRYERPASAAPLPPRPAAAAVFADEPLDQGGYDNRDGGHVDEDFGEFGGGDKYAGYGGSEYYGGAGDGAAVAGGSAMAGALPEAVGDAVGYDHPFFAVAEVSMEEDGYEVAPVVVECVEWLMERGLREEGLFRIPGNLTVMRTVLQRYGDGETGIVAAEMRDEHDVAGLLKLYFREQMMSFIPAKFYGRLQEANDITDRDTRIAAMRSILAGLTPTRFEVVGMLVSLFAAVTANHKVNKMKVSNMAKVFAPTFFKNMGVGTANSILATWIKDFEPIFQSADDPQFYQ